MKLDPKYFNLFAGTVAFFAFLAIIYFTIRYSVTQKTDFVETIGDGTELYETWFTVIDVQKLAMHASAMDSTAQNVESDTLNTADSVALTASIREKKLPVPTPGDSLRGMDFRGKFVVVDFWSTWSDPSIESHTELWSLIQDYSDVFVVIAAGVRDANETIIDFATEKPHPFYYVQGTQVFQKLKVPGVPSQAIFMPSGTMLQLRVGHKGPQDYDVLRSAVSAYQGISEFKLP